MKKRNNADLLRIMSLGGFLLFTTWVAFMHSTAGGGAGGYPTVDSLCPLGGLETMYSWLGDGAYLRRTAPSSIILFFITAVITLVFGRAFCGWICPLGAISDFFSYVGRKLHLPVINVPVKFERVLRLIKYLFLFVMLTETFVSGTLVFRDHDPWVAWAHLSGGWEEILARPAAYVILFAVVMFGSMLIRRMWCRYLCPLGAALGIISLLSPLRVGRAGETTCYDCGLCYGDCPASLQPQNGDVPRTECISCGVCVAEAPEECRVSFRLAGKHISVLKVGIIVLLLFFGGYSGAKAAGYWRTNASSEATVSEHEHGSDEEEKSADVTAPKTAAPANPMEIKGSRTLKDLSVEYGLTPEAILKKAGWPEDLPHDRPLKELKEIASGEIDAVRMAIRDLIK